MDRQFGFLAITRNNILGELNSLSHDQLFEIPKPFNNHILWNAIHVIATQQVLLYGNTSMPFTIDQSIIDQYRKGTTPTSEKVPEMIDFARSHLLATVEEAKENYRKGVFGTYKPITTSYGAPINTIEDAISFLNVHEGMHFGQIKMIKKMILS